MPPNDAAEWKDKINAALGQAAGAWMQRLESLLPPESGALVLMYNKQGDPFHLVALTLNDDQGPALKVLHEAERLLVTQMATDNERTYQAQPLDASPSDHLISSAKVTTLGAHDHVRVWTHGALAGELVLDQGDGDTLCAMLGMINPERAAIYRRQLEAMIDAARAWREAHPSTRLALSFGPTLILGALRPRIESIGCDAPSRAFLEALDAAADGEATVVMAKAAIEFSTC